MQNKKKSKILISEVLEIILFVCLAAIAALLIWKRDVYSSLFKSFLKIGLSSMSFGIYGAYELTQTKFFAGFMLDAFVLFCLVACVYLLFKKKFRHLSSVVSLAFSSVLLVFAVLAMYYYVLPNNMIILSKLWKKIVILSAFALSIIFVCLSAILTIASFATNNVKKTEPQIITKVVHEVPVKKVFERVIIKTDSSEDKKEDKNVVLSGQSAKNSVFLAGENDYVSVLSDTNNVVVESKFKETKKDIKTNISSAKEENINVPVQPKDSEPVVKETIIKIEDGKIENKRIIEHIAFEDKISSADPNLIEKYNNLKEYIENYGVKSRTSVSGDTFRLHTIDYVYITIQGKKMKVYYNLKTEDLANTTYPVKDVSHIKKYEVLSTLLDVKSDLSFKRAKELVDITMKKAGINK